MSQNFQADNETIINGGDVSQATLTSTTYNCKGAKLVSIHANVSGTCAGTLSVQGSNLDSPSYFQEFSSGSIAVSNTGNYIFEVETALDFVRVVYTKTSGTGTLNVIASAKG